MVSDVAADHGVSVSHVDAVSGAMLVAVREPDENVRKDEIVEMNKLRGLDVIALFRKYRQPFFVVCNGILEPEKLEGIYGRLVLCWYVIIDSEGDKDMLLRHIMTYHSTVAPHTFKPDNPDKFADALIVLVNRLLVVSRSPPSPLLDKLIPLASGINALSLNIYNHGFRVKVKQSGGDIAK
jgi:hypothetical protein